MEMSVFCHTTQEGGARPQREWHASPIHCRVLALLLPCVMSLTRAPLADGCDGRVGITYVTMGVLSTRHRYAAYAWGCRW